MLNNEIKFYDLMNLNDYNENLLSTLGMIDYSLRNYKKNINSLLTKREAIVDALTNFITKCNLCSEKKSEIIKVFSSATTIENFSKMLENYNQNEAFVLISMFENYKNGYSYASREISDKLDITIDYYYSYIEETNYKYRKKR